MATATIISGGGPKDDHVSSPHLCSDGGDFWHYITVSIPNTACMAYYGIFAYIGVVLGVNVCKYGIQHTWSVWVWWVEAWLQMWQDDARHQLFLDKTT